jgi:hypothetical protein
MDNTSTTRTRCHWWLVHQCKSTPGALAAACLLPILLLATGCQMDIAGQTLPSPYYLSDDVQYYAPGPSFKLAREAEAMKQQTQTQPAPPPPAAQP